jgi:hypothetical protein
MLEQAAIFTKALMVARTGLGSIMEAQERYFLIILRETYG